jgi:hypothetical protein
VDADIDDSVDLFDKAASDLQEDIEIEGNKISGTVKYIADYSSAGYTGDEESGNFLVLHFETEEEGSTITTELVGGVHGASALDPDGLCIFRITNKSTQTIKVVASKTGYANTVRYFSLKGLTLTPAPPENNDAA